MAGPGRFVGQEEPFGVPHWTTALGRHLDEILLRVSESLANLNSRPLVVEPVALGDSSVADVGTSKSVALEDHVHNLPTAAPAQPTGKTAVEGSAATALRSDARIAQGIVSAKGDLLTHDGSTAERLPVGTDGQVLVADSGEATGQRWTAPGLLGAIQTQTANYTATEDDDVILCDATGGAFTVTLPPAADVEGLKLYLKKIDASANAVTIDADGAEVIDGSLTQSLAARWQSVTIVSNSAAWWIIGYNV